MQKSLTITLHEIIFHQSESTTTIPSESEINNTEDGGSYDDKEIDFIITQVDLSLKEVKKNTKKRKNNIQINYLKVWYQREI